MMVNKLRKKLEALALTIALPITSIANTITEGLFNHNEHEDNFISGMKSMLKLAFRTPFKEVYIGFRDGQKGCNPKYRSLFENSYVKKYASFS